MLCGFRPRSAPSLRFVLERPAALLTDSSVLEFVVHERSPEASDFLEPRRCQTANRSPGGSGRGGSSPPHAPGGWDSSGGNFAGSRMTSVPVGHRRLPKVSVLWQRGGSGLQSRCGKSGRGSDACQPQIEDEGAAARYWPLVQQAACLKTSAQHECRRSRGLRHHCPRRTERQA